jgi:hypothetical protein
MSLLMPLVRDIKRDIRRDITSLWGRSAGPVRGAVKRALRAYSLEARDIEKRG